MKIGVPYHDHSQCGETIQQSKWVLVCFLYFSNTTSRSREAMPMGRAAFRGGPTRLQTMGLVIILSTATGYSGDPTQRKEQWQERNCHDGIEFLEV